MTKYVVSTGHTSSGIMLHPGDTLSTYGTVTSTTVSGAADYVFSGGTASFTAVLLAGNEYVSSGGTAISTTVSNGGTQRVFSSGTTSFTTLSNGGEVLVFGGGVTSLTTVSTGGYEYVSASGKASFTTVNDGGTVYVDYGGSAVSTTVSGGGNDYVYSAGTTSFTTVGSGGFESVESSGTASFTTLDSGGVGYVSNGGTAISTTVHSGSTEYAFSAGTTSFTTVDGGGIEFVEYLGSAISTTVNSGGAMIVETAGSASFTTVGAGGTLVVLPGGEQTDTTGAGTIVSTGAVVYQPASGVSAYGSVALDVDLGSGAIEFVLPGGTARFTTVSSGGTEYVYSSGTTVSGTLSGGSEIVSASGTTSFTTVSSGGIQILESGGTAFGTTADFEGVQTVSSGGTASDTMLLDGGDQFVSVDGSAISTTVQDAYLGVSDGGTVSFTSVTGDGQDVISAGGLAVSTTVASGGEETVDGSTSFTTVGSGSLQNVFQGGTTVSTLVDSGGTQIVYSNGTAICTTVDSGGVELVQSGGRTSFTTVSNGDIEVVFSGGLAVSTTVSTGGSLIVLPGGNASDTVLSGGAVVSTGVVVNYPGSGVAIYAHSASGVVVSNNATEYVLQGGSAVSTTVGQNGVDYIYSGGTTTGTTVHNNGSETIYDSGTASFTTVSGGGIQYVDPGALAVSTTVTGGFELLSAATTSDATVDSGTEYMVRGATAVSTTVNDGGFQIVSGGYIYFSALSGFYPVAGGTTSDTVVNSGGTEEVDDLSTAMSTTIDNGGSETIDGTGATSFTTVSSGGDEFVGGSAVSTTVSSGGVENVDGTTIGTTVDGGGTQFVSNGGHTSFTTIGNGAAEVVLNYGLAISTTVSTGGTLVVLPHGMQSGTVLSGGAIVSTGVVLYRPGAGITVPGSTANGVTVGSGATEYVLPGGSPTSTAVHSGGIELVYSGGTTSFTTVDTGGFEAVSSGGSAVSTTLGNSGYETVSVGATASFTTVNSGGQEVMYEGFATSTTVNLGGSIDFIELGYDAGGTAFVDANDVLSVTVDGTTVTQQLAGNHYASEDFVLSAGHPFGGTQVTLEGTPCYCRGTLILTDRGDTPVEDLHIGDRLVTLAGAVRPIRWIGRRSYAGRFATGNRNVLPILFRRDSLADGAPRRDLLVSPLHAMFLDGVLIPASALVNGTSIVQLEAVEQVEYFHLELDTHDVILAEGAPSETFVDDDSRGMFHNAAEYRLLYPEAPRTKARFCAPRVEDGAGLEAVRLRLAARAAAKTARAAAAVPAATAAATLRGQLDQVDRGRITGWARDIAAPDRPVRLRILDNGVTIGEVTANAYRNDLLYRGIGDGRHGFDFSIVGGLSPLLRHVIRVQRAIDGQDLPNSPWMLDAAPLTLAAPTATAARLHGQVDLATRDRIAGWAQDAADPGTPVGLQILDNGLPIARVLANRGRADLADAGIGNGRYAFDLVIPGGLSPLSRHVIQVQREADGAELPGSPTVIEAANAFDDDLQQTVANAVAAVGADEDRDRVLSFILQQADRLLQQRADAEAHRIGRLAHREFHRRWGPLVQAAAGSAGTSDGLADTAVASAVPVLRALVIDERLPAAGRDAGSQAILSHMRVLQHLGYAVSLVAADEMVPTAAAAATLEAAGVTCCVAPFYAGVEDVLRRQVDCFDVVYMHRIGIATRYLGLARRYMPWARILYSVADLHHVRLERQAAVEARPELHAVSRRVRLEESVAAWSADAVITHSAEEAETLGRLVPEASVYRAPWQVPERAVSVPFSARDGVAFVGSYAHAPNVDAACWLVEAVMPLVWQTDPDLECLLVGSDMPEAVRILARPGVLVLGQVAELGELFDRVRLTVAPLRYGAGVKGKVLESFASGVPCVMSPIAAEGLGLPENLLALVGDDAAALAALICRLHRDADAHRKAARAGRALIRANHAETFVTAALQAAIVATIKNVPLSTPSWC
jgi:autotransporter passenger strand-loop-strand repeat protein